MATATVKDVQALPAVLTMKHVQAVLGISKPKTYELAHTRGFRPRSPDRPLRFHEAPEK